MTYAHPFLSLDNSSDTYSHAPESFTREVQPFVGQDATSLERLSDAALSAFILDCAERMVAAHHRYEAHGNFADAGERDYYWHQEAAALRERGSRPEVVRAMERKLGLA